MSDTGKQSPLGVNAVNSYLNVKGLMINPVFAGFVGSSHNFTDYTFGSICQTTALRVLTYAIRAGYTCNTDGGPSQTTYNNLISIGAGFVNIPISSIIAGTDTGTDYKWFKVTYTNNITLSVNGYVRISGSNPEGYNGNWLIESVGSDSPGTKYFRVAVTANYGTATSPGTFVVDTQVPALGNAKSLVYTWEKPIGWIGTGTFNLGDYKGWGGSLYKNNRESNGEPNANPNTANPATQWGFNRLLALQAWMEFNYNSTLEKGDDVNPIGYRDFLQSFNTAAGFISYSNTGILSVDNSATFLDGTYSNMNDLISGDLTGISLATKAFGQDLITMGKVLNLETISTFGLPSNLLKTLAKHSALTQNISLAIISAGINTNELDAILGNAVQPTIEQEQKLYAAFYLTVGQSLSDALIPLNCKTSGLTSIADLLNPIKLFPNSYSTLTVPVYNTTTQPTNSKTYYPIYINNAINPNLTSTNVLNQIGAQVPIGTPQISTTTPSANIVIQQPVVGFGSYLSSIVPPAQATACGAIAASFLQVKNITNVPLEKLGQVVTNIETIVGLPVNGTSVPTNLTLRNAGRPKIALGSGPQGTYTASDFFGCMSGLPYNGPLTNILARIKEVETPKLYNIYHETYLAASWERAKGWIKQNIYYVNVQPSGPRIDDWYYTISFGLETPGGGYTRGGGIAPTVSLYPNYCGASMTVKVDSNDAHLPGTFGQVIENSKSYGSAYKYARTTVNETNAPTPPIPPEEWIRIQAPPIAMLPIQANGSLSTGAVNVDGYAKGSLGGVTEGIWYWPRGGSDPGMNQVLQGYIDQANAEINSINTSKRASCQSLNNSWNSLGSQLTIEQRARDYGLKPPIDTGPPTIDKSGTTILPQRQNNLSLYPTVVYNFVDSLSQYGLNTEPHMYAQTIENITDYSTPGGQSAVAFMRQQRNQERLALLGIPLDNNIEDKLPYDQQKILIANGTLPTARYDPNIPSGSITANTTNPFSSTTVTGPISTTVPATPIQLDPIGNVIYTTPIGIYVPADNTYLVINPLFGGQTPPIPIDNGNAWTPYTPGNATPNIVTISANLVDSNVTHHVGTPGSWAGTPYPNIVPPPLNTWYSSKTLYPSTYTVQQAIDEVIRCNCDCWQLA
jgi:hypothetical protein